MCPQIRLSVASPLVEAREEAAAGGRNTMSPIVLLTPSPEGTRMGPRSPGLWMWTSCERARQTCGAIWFDQLWLIKVCREVVKLRNPYRKYPQGQEERGFQTSGSNSRIQPIRCKRERLCKD